MGNLVFQAASGGQVALSGPNTASSFTIAVPAVTGTLVTTGDTGTVTTTMLASTTGSGAVVLATSPTLVTPALGTPSAIVLTNATGLPLTTGVTGTLPVANGGTNLTSFTSGGVVYASSTSALVTGSALYFDGTNFGVGTGGNTLNQQSVVYKVGANAVYQQIANGSTGLGATNGVRLGVSAGGTGELYSPTALISYIDNTERARIDSSGNLLVGTTSGSYHIFSKNNSGNYMGKFQNTASSDPYGLVLSYPNNTPNSAANEFLYCTDSTGLKASIRSNGGIANYAANNAILSDRREKTNFAPATSYLDKICAIPVQTFNYIDQNLEEDGGLTLGVVAQDVQAVAPELVTEGNWGTKENPKMRLEIYQTDLQYALMKCIQEQQAIIESLTARLTALENK